MRQQLAPSFIRLIIVTLAFVVLGGGSIASADDRTQARTHYQAGVKFYNAADYRSAIREFSAAQQLAPADLNNYNLALCYDKLGDPEPAMQYYRAYLDRVPNTDKRPEIEASIARLDAAAKSVAAKKAEEARRADEARKETEARAAAEEAKRAEAARKAEELRLAEEAKLRPADPEPAIEADPAVGVGSTGTPGTGGTVSTGDARLDRVSSINIDEIRDQRVGGAASGIVADPGAGPAVAGGAGPAGPAVAGAPAPRGPQANGAPLGPQDQPVKKPAPVYKKWWFWAVVVVSAYVVYQIATEDSEPTRARMLLPEGPAPQQPGGLTLMRW